MTEVLEHKPTHGFRNLLMNLILPVLILNKGTQWLGPLAALLIAMSFPLGYGIFEFYQKRKLNPLSVLGFVNVLFTGTLALLGLGGIWFSLKEAFFPLAIGIYIWFSSGSEKPVITQFLLTPQMMNVDLIEKKLEDNQKQIEFLKLLKSSSQLLAASFFMSALLNFVLADRIFTELDPNLNSVEKATILNQQIAQMTSWSAAVIVIPSTIFLVLILFHLLKGIRSLTGLSNEEILKN